MARGSSWRSTRALYIGTRCAIIDRDGCACVYCGVALEVRTAELDHVVCRADGGAARADNLVTCCGPCNRGRQSGRVVVTDDVRARLALPLDRARGQELARLHYPSRVKGAA